MVFFQSVTVSRLTDRTVRSTLVTACRLATSPVSTSPFLANATTDGVVRDPSALAITVGSPPSNTETTELVVPRSMPTARAIPGSFPRYVLRRFSRAEPTALKLSARSNGERSADVPGRAHISDPVRSGRGGREDQDEPGTRGGGFA